MPRTSRSVAQRLASQAKSRKRRPRTPGAPATTSPANEIVDEGTTSAAETDLDSALSTVEPSRTAAPPVSRTAGPTRRAVSSARSPVGRTPLKTAVPRRRYTEYAAEYSYVSSDLRRILLVAGVLIALLVALSFVIQ